MNREMRPAMQHGAHGQPKLEAGPVNIDYGADPVHGKVNVKFSRPIDNLQFDHAGALDFIARIQKCADYLQATPEERVRMEEEAARATGAANG